jgi:hypothetical protein
MTESNNTVGIATLLASRLALEDLTGKEGALSKPIRDRVVEVLNYGGFDLERITLAELEQDARDFEKKYGRPLFENSIAAMQIREKYEPHRQSWFVKVDKDGKIMISLELKANKPFSEWDMKTVKDNVARVFPNIAGAVESK